MPIASDPSRPFVPRVDISLADNESLGCSQNPSNTPHTDGSPYFLIIKLPGTRRSVYCFHMTSCLAYIVVKLATISHES